MGLDWVASPHPNAATIDETRNQYTRDPTFRGQRLVDSSLPDHLTKIAFRDLTYWEMQSYADDLESHIEQRSYSDSTRSLAQEAIAWLRYWADERKSLYASY